MNDQQQMEEEIRQLKREVDNLKQELARYKGFFGGIILVASSIAACLTLVFQFLSVRG